MIEVSTVSGDCPLAEELTDAGALVADLGVGGREGVFGVERAFTLGRLDLFVLGDGRR